MPLLKKNAQDGVAKLAMFAYDRGSGQLVWTSGTMLAKANAKDVFVLGLGPFQSGSIRNGTEFVGEKLPLGSDRSSGGNGPKTAVPFTTPAIRQPAGAADLESFAP
jgi:hypothetical protein